MIRVTKIFRFETAHALQGYNGACRYIHGHSYVLHVTVGGGDDSRFLGGQGILVDFKDLKKLVQEAVIARLDHQLVLSRGFAAANPGVMQQENVMLMEAEPSAENLLLYIRNVIREQLPEGLSLVKLKLFETADSYAEWVL